MRASWQGQLQACDDNTRSAAWNTSEMTEVDLEYDNWILGI